VGGLTVTVALADELEFATLTAVISTVVVVGTFVGAM
jgi:hypothetical protein